MVRYPPQKPVESRHGKDTKYCWAGELHLLAWVCNDAGASLHTKAEGLFFLRGAWQQSCWPESSSQTPAKGLAHVSVFPSAYGLQTVIGIWLKGFSAPAARKCEDVFLFLLLSKQRRKSGSCRCGSLTNFWSSSFSCIFFCQYFWILPLLQ